MRSPSSQHSKYIKISTFVLTSALLAVGGILLADEDMHWSYSGETGPENWAKLSPEFAACGIGLNQSPIDINKTVSAELASYFHWNVISYIRTPSGHSRSLAFCFAPANGTRNLLALAPPPLWQLISPSR